MDVKAALYEIHRNNLADVSIGEALDSLLLSAQIGGWHHRLGEVMIVSGMGGMLVIQVGAWLRNRGQR